MTLVNETKMSPSSPVAVSYWLFEHGFPLRSSDDNPTTLAVSCRLFEHGFPLRSSDDNQTTLFVLFNEESRHLFSAVRIVVCCRREMSEEKMRGWDIKQLGSAPIDSSEGKIHEPEDDILSNPDSYSPSNVSALQECTVVFEVVDYEVPGYLKKKTSVAAKLVLRPADYSHLLNHGSFHVLLEYKRSLSPDTLAVSLYFGHSAKLCTPMDLRAKSDHNLNILLCSKGLCITRVVRVLPEVTASPRITRTNGGLPMEILLQIFWEVSRAFYSGWRRDLLSCALVCRNWSCSLDLLLWDLHGPRRAYFPPNIHALGKALTEQPALGLSIKNICTEQLRSSLFIGEDDHKDSASVSAFTLDLITIIRTARNIQSLALENLDSSQSEALASALYGLRDLSTFSTGRTDSPNRSDDGVIGIVHLAHCLASWPSLKSLTMYASQPHTITKPALPLRLPVCALTELSIESVFMTNNELMYLMSTSLRTLEHVTLNKISGITNVGLRRFLDAISQNVSCLTIRHTGECDIPEQEERALDATINKMRHLRKLDVMGDVATKLMLQRRTELFATNKADEGLNSELVLPVVQLQFALVTEFTVSVCRANWPGWEIFEPNWLGRADRMYSQEDWEARRMRPACYVSTLRDYASSRDSVQ